MRPMSLRIKRQARQMRGKPLNAKTTTTVAFHMQSRRGSRHEGELIGPLCTKIAHTASRIRHRLTLDVYELETHLTTEHRRQEETNRETLMCLYALFEFEVISAHTCIDVHLTRLYRTRLH